MTIPEGAQTGVREMTADPENLAASSSGAPSMNAELDGMVRDFTKIGPRPKSEVRARIEAYASERVAAVEKQVEQLLGDIHAVSQDYTEARQECRAKENDLIRLERENQRLREVLVHQLCRTHDYNPAGCSACEKAEAALRESHAPAEQEKGTQR